MEENEKEETSQSPSVQTQTSLQWQRMMVVTAANCGQTTNVRRMRSQMENDAQSSFVETMAETKDDLW